jgi:hypothetical protein
MENSKAPSFNILKSPCDFHWTNVGKSLARARFYYFKRWRFGIFNFPAILDTFKKKYLIEKSLLSYIKEYFLLLIFVNYVLQYKIDIVYVDIWFQIPTGFLIVNVALPTH